MGEILYIIDRQMVPICHTSRIDESETSTLEDIFATEYTLLGHPWTERMQDRPSTSESKS